MKRIFLAFLIMCVFAQPCGAAEGAKKEVKEGNVLYNKGKFDDALKRYEDALLDLPDSDVVNFNMGAALYKTDDYKRAIEHFEKSLVSDDPSLEQKASYNIGNAKYKYGIGKEETDLQGAIKLLEESLRYYEGAIELDEKDEDAKHNYEFVKKELERLKRKQQQQPQQKQQPEEKKKEEEKEQERPKKKGEEEKEGQQEKKEEQQAPAPQEEGEEQEDEPEPQEGAPEQPAGEMTEEEAEMLLDNYRHEEEPKGLYQKRLPKGGLPEVQKDW